MIDFVEALNNFHANFNKKMDEIDALLVGLKDKMKPVMEEEKEELGDIDGNEEGGE